MRRLEWNGRRWRGCVFSVFPSLFSFSFLLADFLFFPPFSHAPPPPPTQVFRKEFGLSPLEAFDSFDKTPIASASIAQVHRARLKREPGQPEWKEGEGWVAVKVRKEAIPKQMEW
jgi:hypothetical protein